MKVTRRETVLGALACASLPIPAWSASYPDRPIQVVIPFGAGGAGDIVFRLLAPKAEAEVKQTFVVLNKPGAGGNIGMEEVATARADGYTLLCGATNNFVINQFMYKLRSDPLTALQPIIELAKIPTVLYTNPSVPATLPELIAYSKKHPGKLTYSSPGIGTTPHLAVERLKQLTGLDIRHIPYSGAPQALQALLSNEVQLYGAGAAIGRAYVQQKKINALMVCSKDRLPVLPDVPTSDEAGQKGFYASNWFALAAPAKTPQPIVEEVHAAFVQSLQDPGTKRKYDDLGFVADVSSPSELRQAFQSEAATWKVTIEQAGLLKK